MRGISRRILRFSYWLMMFVQVFALRTAGIGPSERDVYLDQAAWIRIVTTAFLFAVLLGMRAFNLLPRGGGRRLSDGQKALILLGGSMVLCSFWSPVPLTAIFRLAQLGVTTAVTWYFIAAIGKTSLENVIWELCLPALVAGVLNGLLAPGKIEIFEAGYIGFADRFKENACGHVAAIASMDCLVGLIWNPARLQLWRRLSRFVFSLTALALFRSGAGVVLFAMAVLVIAILDRKTWLVLIALAIILLSMFFLQPLELVSASLPGSGNEKIEAMTDRFALYRVAADYGMRSPLWGHGYLAEAKLAEEEATLGWVPQHAHNGYLSAFLGFGFLGIAALMFSLFLVYRGLRAFAKTVCHRGLENAVVLAQELKIVFLMLMIGNLVESWVGGRFTLLWPMFVAVAVIPKITENTAPSIRSRGRTASNKVLV